MLEKKDQIATLIRKYFREELTAEESHILELWLSENQEHRNLLNLLNNDEAMEAEMKLYASCANPDIWEKIQPGIGAGKSRHFFSDKYVKYTACFAAIIILGWGIWYFLPGKRIKNTISTTPATSTWHPSIITQPGNKAELELADGSRILLHEQQDGLIPTQGVFKVFKHKEDLYYQTLPGVVPTGKLYNTITTPRGGHYRVILPDGSAISMNVASSLRFTVAPASVIREVDMTGEVAFDITSNPAIPFKVTILPGNNHSTTGKVEVTGTRFNVNAYNDGTVKKITLLTGSLQVFTLPGQHTASTGQPPPLEIVTLSKGEQAEMQENGSINIIQDIDTAAVVAWKQGSVFFVRTKTRELLNTIEKWYDVQVTYETNKVPEFPFTGKITPATDIETVLDIMQFQCDNLHLKFDRKQKKITVLP